MGSFNLYKCIRGNFLSFVIGTGLYSLINFPCQATFHVNQLLKFVNQLSIYLAQLIATLIRLVFSLSRHISSGSLLGISKFVARNNSSTDTKAKYVFRILAVGDGPGCCTHSHDYAIG